MCLSQVASQVVARKLFKISVIYHLHKPESPLSIQHYFSQFNHLNKKKNKILKAERCDKGRAEYMFSLCWKHFQSSDIQGGEAFLFFKKKKVLCKYLEQWPCTYVCTKILHMTQVQPSSKNVALLFCFPCFHFDMSPKT